MDRYEHPRGYVCHRVKAPLRIDGDLDKPEWKAAPWTDDFVDIEGDVRPHPLFRTRAKMLWDAGFFYIAAELEEPHVWATLTEHDAVIFQDNDFEVFIDPDGDNHNYYELEINALNTTWDLRLPKPYRDGGPALNEWEIPGMKTAVKVQGTLNNPTDTDKGWTVEIALPWKVLGEYTQRPAPPRDGDAWRVNFSRVEWETVIEDGKYRKVEGKREDNWVWSPQGAIDMHRPERWGYVQFSEKPTSTRVPFRPDPAAPLKFLFHRLYYAMKAYEKEHGRYAATPQELGFTDLNHASLAEPVGWMLTPEGYTASARLKQPGKVARTWHMRQDSLVWVTE